MLARAVSDYWQELVCIGLSNRYEKEALASVTQTPA